MRIFKTKEFTRDARKLGISDATLRSVIAEIEQGNFDAALGGEIFKQRIARGGAGKSGGYRTIIVFRQSHRSVFIDVYAKNAVESLSSKALKSFKQAADIMLGLPDSEITELLISKIWIEIENNEKDISI